MAAKKKKKRLFLNHSNITPPNKFINSFTKVSQVKIHKRDLT